MLQRATILHHAYMLSIQNIDDVDCLTGVNLSPSQPCQEFLRKAVEGGACVFALPLSRLLWPLQRIVELKRTGVDRRGGLLRKSFRNGHHFTRLSFGGLEHRSLCERP